MNGVGLRRTYIRFVYGLRVVHRAHGTVRPGRADGTVARAGDGRGGGGDDGAERQQLPQRHRARRPCGHCRLHHVRGVFCLPAPPRTPYQGKCRPFPRHRSPTQFSTVVGGKNDRGGPTQSMSLQAQSSFLHLESVHDCDVIMRQPRGRMPEWLVADRTGGGGATPSRNNK